MGGPRQAQPAGKRRRPARQWTVGETAPGWFRRVWKERSREVPKADDRAIQRKKVSEGDLARIRRIAYL